MQLRDRRLKVAIVIRVEDNPYQEQLITLNGNSLFLTITYNTRDSRWYLDLEDRNGKTVVSGVKVIPNLSLTGKYVNVNTIIGGDIYCMDLKRSSSDITRSNFGNNKQFQLWYYSNEEIKEILG